MITYKLNRLGLAYKKQVFNKNWTVFSIEIPADKTNTFSLNIQSNNNCYIDWGDDIEESQIEVTDDYYKNHQILDSDKFYPASDVISLTRVSHAYELPGRYLIKLKGVQHFQTAYDENNNTESPYITNVYQLGNCITSCINAFKDNIYLDYLHTNLRIPYLSEQGIDCSHMFQNCQSILTLPEFLFYKDINNIETNYNQVNFPEKLTPIKNHNHMFAGCKRLMYLPEHFVIYENTEDIDSMFESCEALNYIRLVI